MWGRITEASGKRPVTILGGTVALAALSSLFPGIKDDLAALIANVAGSPIPVIPTNLTLGIFVVGLCMVLGDQIAASRSKLPKIFIAFYHRSIQTLSAPALSEADLPRNLRNAHLEHIDCDQTFELAQGRKGLQLALGVEDRALAKLENRLSAKPQPVYGYYGTANIPFQIKAGCRLSQTTPYLFELGRSDRKWHELRRGSGPDLEIKLSETLCQGLPSFAAIRIAISYPIADVDVEDIVTKPFDDIIISAKVPKPDIITHYSQVDEVTKLFRGALDRSMQRIPNGSAVNLFYAGPMSLGFALGRMISQTNHPRVIAYNHSRQSSPRYSWGVAVNSVDKTSDLIIVR